eukprot:14733957-Alexandrium_andersonii.AAC.1
MAFREGDAPTKEAGVLLFDGNASSPASLPALPMAPNDLASTQSAGRGAFACAIAAASSAPSRGPIKT